MAVLAITFSGGIGIVLFRLTLGLKAQKRLARAERQRRPELMCHTIVALQGQKRYFAIYLQNAIFLNYQIKFARLR